MDSFALQILKERLQEVQKNIKEEKNASEVFVIKLGKAQEVFEEAKTQLEITKLHLKTSKENFDCLSKEEIDILQTIKKLKK